MSNVKFDSRRAQFVDAKDLAVERALEIIGIKAEKYAKALCPVDTGNLRNSISHGSDKEKAYVGTNVEYAPYQELGTMYIPPANGGKGYIRPAVLDHIKEYSDVVHRELKNA